MNNTSKIKIIIADDDPVSRLMSRAVIELVLPYAELFEAEYGAHLILMDVQMPGVDGVEASAKIRDLPGGKEVPIISFSSETELEKIKNLPRVGFNGIIPKPFNQTDFLTILNTWNLGNNTPVTITAVPAKISENLVHFDRENILARLGNDDELLAEILDGIKEYLPKFLPRFSETRSENNLNSLNKLGHELKGAALTASFVHLSNLGLKLEKWTNPDPVSLDGLLSEIETELIYVITNY
jgi:CheY-like chemotaxis protein/HPt (histidine-containing phosphotransfer) domain-containing protein